MRISDHSGDLLVTDQTIGSGGLLAAAGTVGLVTGLSQLLTGLGLSIGVAALCLLSAAAIKLGLDRLSAMQIIVDRDTREVVTKHWSFRGSDTQRIPFSAVKGFSIEPEGQHRKTQLLIQTTRGPVLVGAGMKAIRSAWEEIVHAVEAHMRSEPADGEE
ncbi:MAG: hypothetical protein AAF590_03520 [Pseudomonadota bacterium]